MQSYCSDQIVDKSCLYNSEQAQLLFCPQQRLLPLDFRSPEDEARQQWRHHQPSQSVPTAGVATWNRGVVSFS